MVNEYKKLFINAHIFTMRFQGDRNPLPHKGKKKDSQEYKTPWPGNNWSSLGYLPKTLNIKASPIRSQLHAKTTDKSPNKSKQGPKLFLFFGRQNRLCFLRIILRVETISMLSSNETLPNMQCSRAHSHGALRKHTCPVPSSAPLHTAYYMYPGRPAIIFSLSGKSPNKCLARLGVVKCNCRQRVKQMLTLGFLLNSEVVNTKLTNLGLCPDFILEYFMCPRFPLECSESY